MERALAYRFSLKLASGEMSEQILREIADEAYESDPELGQSARAEISEFLGRTVHLFLQVKVRPNWMEEPERFDEMGLDFRDGDA